MAFSTPNPSVWVGALDPTVDEQKLYDFFSRVGTVASVRVCVDTTSQKSLGYGYVNFQNPDDADKALEMAGHKLGSRSIQISKIQRDPSKRRAGVRNIVVKKLPLDMDAMTLKELFSKFGRMTCVNLACNEKGDSRGYARIGFENEESAIAAVTEMNGFEVNGHAIVVERFHPQHREEQFANLYVKNLDPNVKEDALKEVFAPYGTITSVKVRDFGEKKAEVGFAYVAYSDHAGAAAAMEALNGKECSISKENMTLDVGRFRSAEERSQERERLRRERAAMNCKYPNLYVKGFDDTVTSESLRALFERYGETVSARVMMDSSGISRCFGFVSMKEQGAAARAVHELNGSQDLSPRPLFVTYAVRKDARRQNLEERNRQQARARQPPMNPGGVPPMGFMGPNMFGNLNMQFMNRVPVMNFQNVNPAIRPMHAPNPMNQMRASRPIPVSQQKLPMAPMMSHPPAIPPAGQSLSALLASSPPEHHRNILGERLYNYIVRTVPSMAPKITGMLLEMDHADVVNMLEDQALLDSKIDEAKEVLQVHMRV